MTFEMTIRRKRPTSDGIEEQIVRIKNSQALPNGEDLLSIIRLALESSSVTAEELPKVLNVPETKPPQKAKPKQEGFPEVVKITRPPETSKSRPKQLDLIGSERSAFSIGEMMQPKEEKKKEVIAAKSLKYIDKPAEVIDRDPKRRVKLWVNCVECEFEGDRGIALGTRLFVCPSCKTPLYVIDATEEHGAPDDKGYVRLAQYRFHTAEERFARKQLQDALD